MTKLSITSGKTRGGLMSVFRGRLGALVVSVPLAVFTLAACGSSLPPRELVEARASYKKAESGNAAKLKPAELHVAKAALDKAEAQFNDSPDDQKVKDLAYVAGLKAQQAEAMGNAAAAMEEKTRLEKEAGQTTAQMLEANDKKLKGLEGDLSKSKEEIAKGKDALAKEKEETAKEKAARLEAEKKAKDAMDALAKSMAMKQDDRGTVITLSGGVLFATGQSTLLPGAQDQLNKVADALKTQAERTFTVEGHTDNVGTDATNQTLSQKRAEAVREYLIVRGVSANAITAVGKGSMVPIGDNKTPEGRAMNRRVEIIVGKS
jgi:outer membrane protein OmpA-like peptidoglycan-associated protein